jgi:hypothetical protein
MPFFKNDFCCSIGESGGAEKEYGNTIGKNGCWFLEDICLANVVVSDIMTGCRGFVLEISYMIHTYSSIQKGEFVLRFRLKRKRPPNFL